MQHRIRHLVLASLSLTLLGCPLNLPGQLDPDAQGSVATPSIKLSELNGATYTDVVVAPDKSIHVIYGDKHRSNDIPRVYYRRSTDGGKTWSEPAILSDGDPDERPAGYMQLAIDGDGRIYAFWKAFPRGQDGSDPVSSGSTAGTLVYRVLDGATWSDLVEVGTPDNAFAWFTSVDGAGQVHLVWCEGTTYPIYQDGPLSVAGKADVFEASITHTTVGKTNVLIDQNSDPAGTKVDVYESLRGYVDDAGRTHFVAQKSPMEDPYRPIIVYWNDGQERKLFPLDRVTELNNPYLNSPPQVLPDAAGRDHLIYWDQRAERPRLQDHLLEGNAEPVVIFETMEAGGLVQNFQAHAGPGGSMLALVTAKDVKDPLAAAELFLARNTAKGWSQPVALTGNNQAGTFGTANPEDLPGSHISQSVEYKPLYAAAKLDSAGRANVVMINDAITLSGGYSYASGGFGFRTTEPNAYFLRL